MSGPRWNLLRGLFLIAVVAGAWWSWRDSGDEIEAALGRLGAGQVVTGGALVAAGLLLTGWAWWISLEAFGVGGPPARMVPQFFVAQLGKYIPGSVWAFVAQGAIGARQGVPPRVASTATVLFLGVHVASGLVLTGVAGWWTSLPAWLVGASLVVGAVGLVPAVHRALGRRLAGQACDWGWGRSLAAAAVMVPAWCCYALALVVVTPEPDPSQAVALGCAFAVAFAAGVAVPIAPAGLGARDGVLVLLLAPVLGAGSAGAVALVARLLHTVADFVLAGASWVLVRTSAARRGSGPPPGEH